MKNKIITTFIILLTAVSMANAAETLDVPQNTIQSQEEITTTEKNNEQKESSSKKFFWQKKKVKKQNEEITNTEDFSNEAITTEVSEEQNKKFFSNAEKTPQDQTNEDIQNTEPTTDVIIDSDTIEYFPERHEIEAIGDAKITFPSEDAVLHADKLVFNHDTNYIKGFGNVVLIKDGQKISGEFIQVDLNENNAMMSRPVLNHLAIKLRAKTAIVTDAQTEALDGTVTFNEKAHYKFTSRPIMQFDNPMMDEVIPKNFYFKEKYDNKWRLKAKTIEIDSYKDRDIATLKNADIYIQNTKLASAGKLKLYTDKEQNYIETNMLGLGSLRNIGAYISPGFVFKTPNASTLRLGPALTYGNSELGVGGLGRFMTDRNKTDFGWASSNDKIVVRGNQEITDNLTLQYGMNSYMDNWFLGGRMPKYGLQFKHHKSYDIEDLDVTFQNRFIAGFAHDWGNHDFSTTKFAWQTMTTKSLFKYRNPERKFAMDFGINLQSHAAMYGTGDTVGIFRAGPYFRTQYKSWQQYLGYFQGGQAGESPMNFDKNYYGKSNIVLGESLRICKYLTLMYTATIALADTPNDKLLQENRIYAAIGPDDLKFLIGYDNYRRNASMGLMMNIGAENSEVEFKRLILNDPQAISQHDKKEKEKMIAQKKKVAENQKNKDTNPMDRSVKDYNDYEPGFNMLPGTIIQPSLIRPPGMY